MSSGQKPRRPEYFPRMRYRARKRHHRHGRVIFWDQDWTALWPQPILVPLGDGHAGIAGKDGNGVDAVYTFAVMWDEAMRYSGRLHALEDVAAELGVDLDAAEAA